MNKNDVGKIITENRKKMKLSQKELSEIMGVSKETILAWEHNDRLPDTKLVPKLAKTLDISCDELLGDDMNKEVTTLKEKKESRFSEYIVPALLALNILLLFVLPLFIKEDSSVIWIIYLITLIFSTFFTIVNKNKFIYPIISIISFLITSLFFYKQIDTLSLIGVYLVFIFIGFIVGNIICSVSDKLKKPLIYISILCLVLYVTSFLGLIPNHIHKDGDISNVEINISDNDRYTNEEMVEAVLLVLNKLKEYPATTTDLTYVELSEDEYQSYLKEYNVDKVLILSTHFETYKELYIPKDSGFSANSLEHYKWLLVKDKNNNWYIEGRGFF